MYYSYIDMFILAIIVDTINMPIQLCYSTADTNLASTVSFESIRTFDR